MSSKIYTIGDSHCWHGWLNVPEVEYLLRGPMTMFSVGDSGHINLAGVPEDAAVILCWGEIDCRCQIGKFPDWEKRVDDMVQSYLGSVREMAKTYKRLFLFNVVPPPKKSDTPENPGYPFVGSDELRLAAVKRVNDGLRNSGFPFVDVYNQYSDEDGYLRKDMSDGHVHIKGEGPLIKWVQDNLEEQENASVCPEDGIVPYTLRHPARGCPHPMDVEYFSQHPAPLMEMLHTFHHTNINATIPFFGPMLYFFAREIGAEQVLEIGHAEGYTSHYLAHAVKDNGIRFQMPGNKYYGIDIVQSEKVRKQLTEKGLWVDVRDLDSALLGPDTFPGVMFDLIFQDGNHDTEHVLSELAAMYPQLKGEGKGYWIMHDVFGPAEEGSHAVKKLIDEGVYNFEYVRIFTPYGLGIFRKMDGWDETKRHWQP
jgi:hypothetical protein